MNNINSTKEIQTILQAKKDAREPLQNQARLQLTPKVGPSEAVVDSLVSLSFSSPSVQLSYVNTEPETSIRNVL